MNITGLSVFCTKNSKWYLFPLFLALGAASVWGQTNPVAQSLPYTQSFAGLAHSGTTYPAGWQGWQLSTAGPLTNFRVTAPTANLNLTANSTAATNSGGVHNYNGKIGLLQSGTNDPAIALAINTTGLSSVKVSYDIMTIRNPYDGSTNTRISEATLQYRVGTSGNFTTLSGIEYQNITTTQTTAVTTPQNLQNKSITLPSACDNNAVVQLRWVARDGTGSGARPSFAIDNVAICTPPPCSISGADYVCNNTPGNIYMAPAGMASYSWGISGNGSIPGSTTGQSVSVTSGNYLNTYTVAVTITDANGCTSTCSKLSDIFLFTPPANITVNPNPACFGVTLNLSISAASSSTVSWTGEGIVNASGNPSTTAIPTSTGPHTYGVTVTADNGCSNTGTASVNVNPLPAAPNCPTSSSTCLNTPAYALTGGSPGSGVYSGPGVSAGMFNPASAGPGAHTITYTVTDGNSCTNTCTFTITVHPTPACSITFANPPPGGLDEACANSTGNVYSAPAGMNSYNWSISGSGTITSATTGSSVTVTAGNSGSYNLYLTVTDDNGCSSACSDETPIKPSPTCSLSGPDPVCANSTGNVYSVSNGSFTISSYSWSISGDGVITSATNGSSITVTAGASGAYTVNVTSVGFNACPSNCSQMVTINSASTPAITGPASVCSGSNVILDAGAGYSSYAWSNGGGSGQTATFNNVTSTTTYSVTVTNSGCTGTDTHEVVVQSCIADFSGKIIFSNNNSLGVNNATVSLSGSATDSDVSDINGDFFVSSGIPSGSFTLKPTKTINKLNGVTVADVTAIQQHISNSVPINDLYKLVAADVNKTNSINSLDVTVVNQSLLGNPAALAQFKTSWRFVPTSHTMTNPPWGFPEQRNYTNINTSQINQDFYGIKTGDVTTVYANPANFGNGEPLVLLGKDRVLQAGETFTLEINAEPLNDLAAFQCAMRFDPDQLQFIDIQPLTALPLAADNFGTYNIAGGEIRLVWAQATGMAIPEAAPVFKLTFTAQQSGGKLSEVFELDESELAALAFTGALNESKVELQFSDLTATHNPAGANGVQLFQNRPNPFSGTTAIGFVLPEACEVQLRVFDVSGSMLAEHKGQYPAGKNEERFELNVTTGLLYYELTTPFGVWAKKMVAAGK